ncbi:monofunctional biosynthetic peptidoglycan transglycosylase [Antarcticimicrobium luteum]|uniref:Biosynthetic peptidoglycan transglycosylase n=1 Tax=Antarcticimicrobium luteum TaxID=2547397 RepID=A0A4R5UYR4_9RHOB|nr:monofunctional biosynthetic peptidoglycan transglycosylase [Antarcticimicrobium luteum]TDK44528.1 monofunctional biosynthetic peptidoglycan transglycosylase [Antarcticimicrobium luteum]
MARKTKTSKTASKPARKPPGNPAFAPVRWLRRWALRIVLAPVGLVVVLVLLFSVVNPPITHTMWVEYGKYGRLEREWVPLEQVAPVMARAVVAAEDANFCQHWGFDLGAIRAAIAEGASRGGSTLTQQVVKNVFLWQGRSWIRKALETAITPLVEAVWSKRRIVEVYLNVAEMGEGLFGVAAASRSYFKVAPGDLTARQAALIAAVLPSPRSRSVTAPSDRVRQRAAAIADGAATIRADGRSACFED